MGEKECTCPEDHTITKLGHCASCPYASRPNYIQKDFWQKMESLSIYGCGRDKHHDGTPHDFEWATYSDDHQSHGVCRCGLSQLDHDLLRLP